MNAGSPAVRIALSLSLAIAALLPATARAESCRPSRTDHFVSGADQVPIDTTLMLPAETPPAAGWPVVIWGPGFGSTKDSVISTATDFACRGYAGVVYTHRGRGASGGRSTAFGPKEVEDVRHVIDWVTGLPGVDASAIGIGGGSNAGMIAWLVAGADVRVRAIWAADTTSDLWESFFPRGVGKLAYGVAQTAVEARNDPLTRRDPALDDGAPIYQFFAEGAATGLTDVEVGDVREQFALRSPKSVAQAIRDHGTAVYMAQGWYDGLFPSSGVAEMWDLLTAPGGPPVHLYLGAGGHPPGRSSKAESDWLKEQRNRWFDRWLKSADNGIDTEPRVTFAVAPPGFDDAATPWRRVTAASWPPAGNESDLYPSAATPAGPGLLGEAPGTGLALLASGPPASGVGQEPVLLRTASSSISDAAAAVPGTPAESIAFDGAALASDRDYAGVARVTLAVRSTAPTVHLFAKLFDVDSGGNAFFITGAPQRAEGLRPDAPTTIAIDLFPAGYQLAAGHHLQLVVATADFPAYASSPQPGLVLIDLAVSSLRMPMLG